MIDADRPPIIRRAIIKMAEYTEAQVAEINQELEDAKRDLENNDPESAQRHIERAQAIVGDPEGPGE
jgi:hypothetical protein